MTTRTQIFFDGHCPLCSKEARGYQRRDRLGRLEFVDIAAPGFDAAAYGLDAERINEVMHARTADGVVHTQVDAFRTIWRALPGSIGTRVALGVLAIPGMLPVANVFYRMFARNRYRLTGRCVDGVCALPSQPPAE